MTKVKGDAGQTSRHSDKNGRAHPCDRRIHKVRLLQCVEHRHVDAVQSVAARATRKTAVYGAGADSRAVAAVQDLWVWIQLTVRIIGINDLVSASQSC